MYARKSLYILHTLALIICANCFIPLALTGALWAVFPLLLLFVGVDLIVLLCRRRYYGLRLNICANGTALLKIFLPSCVVSVIYHIYQTTAMQGQGLLIAGSILLSVAAHSVIYLHAVISVYCTSVQLGIKHRVVGLILAFIPLINIIQLIRMIRILSAEVAFETGKADEERLRKDMRLCATRYPILLVHGVFFRDSKYLNYWGRIPKSLELNGASVFYGDHQSAASVEDSAWELTERIKDVCRKQGCDKVNIIAHSKGGLDCRYAIACCGAAEYVASLTTINTPHRGCEFVDHFLNAIPLDTQQKIADTYNSTLKKFGDHDPDFIAAVRDLTANACLDRDREMLALEDKGILRQSVGSVLPRASGGKFPLNFTYALAKPFSGPNDGLVAESSFEWGEKYTRLTPTGKRGISHGDVIDLNRENIAGFDVREFYVQLVNELKMNGL